MLQTTVAIFPVTVWFSNLAYRSITALWLTIRTWSCKGEKSSKQVRAVQHICPWDPPEREQPKIFPAYSCTATVQDVCGNKQASRWSPLKKWSSVECFSFFMGPRAQLEHVPQLLIIPLTARHQQSPPSSNATWLLCLLSWTHSHTLIMSTRSGRVFQIFCKLFYMPSVLK